jgi:hypothetical protein
MKSVFVVVFAALCLLANLSADSADADASAYHDGYLKGYSTGYYNSVEIPYNSLDDTDLNNKPTDFSWYDYFIGFSDGYSKGYSDGKKQVETKNYNSTADLPVANAQTTAATIGF